MLCNGVFSGGGVRGIGHVGAVSAFEEYGYKFYRVAGTSAGAIVASLIASGYSGGELFEIMQKIDYQKFCEEKAINRIGISGDIISLLLFYGIYSTDYFEKWLYDLLKYKNVETFGDLKISQSEYKLQVTASDITHSRLLVFPQDAVLFGIKPDEMNVARAVRMSISIPFFYKPVVLKDYAGKKHYIADGALLSNYPIYLVDRYMNKTNIPTFGFKFINTDKTMLSTQDTCNNIVDYCKFTLKTMLSAQDNTHISVSSGDYARTVFTSVNICVNGKEKIVGAADFDISFDESYAMYLNGREAGKKFLAEWNFNDWKDKYRNYKMSLTNIGK